MKSTRRNILFNSVFWLLYFLYEWLGNGSVGDEYRRYFINALMVIPTAFMTSYLSVHVLFRNYYHSNRRIFWVGLFCVAIFFVFFRRIFNYYYTYPLYYPEGQTGQSLVFLPKLIIEFVNLYLIVSLYAMFYFVRAWYEQQKTVHELKEQKTKAELELLKSQVQPHFLFNTLNNIYSVTVKKSPETANYLLKLASFLDYNLYNSGHHAVPLDAELSYVTNYTSLQQLRHGDRVDVSINIYNNISDVQIPPLLLLPLIENCFKHGVDTSLDNSWITIDVLRKNEELTIKIENSKDPAVLPSGNKTKRGIGLENVRKRLSLIYPEKHEFKVFNEANKYLLVLKIDLS